MSTLASRLSPGVKRAIKSKWLERIVNFGLVPVLLIYALWLPPVSIGNRAFHLDYPLIGQEGGVLDEAAGGRLTIPTGALGSNLRAKISSVPVTEWLAKSSEDRQAEAIEALPPDVTLRGRVYELDTHGEAPSESVFSVPIPDDAENLLALDMYAYDGTNWEWVPSHVFESSDRIKAELDSAPEMLAVVESPLVEPFFSAQMPADGAAADVPEELLSAVLLQGATVQGDGSVTGEVNGGVTPSVESTDIYAVVSNVIDGVVRSDLVDNIIINGELTAGHISEIVRLATDGGYPGILIDYRGVDSELRREFSDFIGGLADALHVEGRYLATRVEWPLVVSKFNPDTGAYNWRAIGASSDNLVVPVPMDIDDCAVGGELEQLLTWATGEVQRTKLHLAISAMSCDTAGGETSLCTYNDVLSGLARVVIAEGEQMLNPGESLRVELSGLEDSAGLNYDAPSCTYWYSYVDDAGEEHTVSLTTAESIASRLQWTDHFRLGGVVLTGALTPGNDADVWDAVRDFQNQTWSAQGPELALVWTISTDKGDPIGSQIVPLGLTGRGGASEEAVLAAKSPAEESQASAAEALVASAPDTETGGSAEGTTFVWTAPNNPGNYVISLSISDDGGQSTAVQGGSVDVEVPTPTPSPTPTSTPTPTPTPTPTSTPTPLPTPTPKPVVVAKAMAGTGFGYGIQADMVTDGDHGRIVNHVHQLGFKWIKQQVEWFRYHPAPGQYDWGTLDRIVDACVNNGINVMFSVVKAPKWARPPGDTDEGPPADPNVYGEFLRAMAERYKGRVKAYEVWNEQNLYYEWGGRGGKLNAGKYVELLRVAYQAIKSVDPGAIVISGALTPTGYNDGDIAIDDRVYLEQMYQAGLARYCDAVGAHPSGYNNPPDADWRSYSDPTAGFNATGHPSWFFRGTLESYRNIMVKYGDGHKRIWVTEFGWATVQNLGVPPAQGYEYAADNTEDEQAAWLVRAYQMGREWGWVGVMFLWNLNFGPVSGRQDEKAAFGVVRPDWSIRPSFAALAHMPK